MSQNKVLVTGAKGQLGMDLVQALKQKGYEVHGFGRDVLDITQFEDVSQVLHKICPNVVIHAAAYTNVDLAESEPDRAYDVNAYGTRNIAVVAEQIGAKLVYVSTDYVFDGTSPDPYHEFSATGPIGIYGKSKLAGELFVRDHHSRFFIVRTSWVFGRQGKNFVKTMLNLAKDKNILSVVSDQVGGPTYTVDLVQCILNIMASEKYGIYHVSNSGRCSWYEFAKEIFEQADIDIQVLPVTTKEFRRPAPRPKNSLFDHMALRLNGFSELRYWKEALVAFLQELGCKNEKISETEENSH